MIELVDDRVTEPEGVTDGDAPKEREAVGVEDSGGVGAGDCEGGDPGEGVTVMEGENEGSGDEEEELLGTTEG